MDFLCIALSWLFIVGGARRFQVEINHYCIHNRIFKSKALNRWLVEFVSTVFFTQDWKSYSNDHIQGHHKCDIFCGPNDADWIFLQKTGLRPGMSREKCWHWLFITAFSPSFHTTFLTARLKANFGSSVPARRILTVAWWSGLLAAVNFLKRIVMRVRAATCRQKYKVGNIDVTLCLEQPRINPHIPAMKKAIAAVIGIAEAEISIKATTNERLGYIGRGEGAAAYLLPSLNLFEAQLFQSQLPFTLIVNLLSNR